ncbi:MAG: phosphoesterase [Planctomycetes bacterium]|nr:phosphoesterase [Planctomycetota bacterium]MCC7172470.1 phosphoesterase [Planctomycetota bacterium]
MTERLYFHDANELEFDARVIAVTPHARGHAIVLDRTAFYPEGGGQPADSGELGGGRVVDVQESDGAIVHVVEGRTPEVGARVVGRVDAGRRQDHREQHSGQHLLTRAFIRVAGANTLSFHLGADVATIDLDKAALSDRQFEAVEDEAARVIRDDRKVTAALYLDPSERPTDLRKIPIVDGAFRVITIDEYDVCACGGTHVDRTAEIGAIALVRHEKLPGDRLRVTFVCGGRARRDHRAKSRLVRDLVKTLSVGEADVLAAVAQRIARAADLDKARRELERELIPTRVDRLVADAEPLRAGRLLVTLVPASERDGLQDLARGCSQRKDLIAVLCSGGDKPQCAIACGGDHALSAAAVLKALLEPIGGRGGGSPRLAFGGFPAQVDAAVVAAAARAAILAALPA